MEIETLIALYREPTEIFNQTPFGMKTRTLVQSQKKQLGPSQMLTSARAVFPSSTVHAGSRARHACTKKHTRS